MVVALLFGDRLHSQKKNFSVETNFRKSGTNQGHTEMDIFIYFDDLFSCSVIIELFENIINYGAKKMYQKLYDHFATNIDGAFIFHALL